MPFQESAAGRESFGGGNDNAAPDERQRIIMSGMLQKHQNTKGGSGSMEGTARRDSGMEGAVPGAAAAVEGATTRR